MINTKLPFEGGVTEISLDNAKILIEQHGLPTEITFRADKVKCDYNMNTLFVDGYRHNFSGFAWGYGGTAPAGLARFFELAQISALTPDDITIDKYGRTFMTWTR